MERMRAELEQLKKKKVDLVKQAKENQKKFLAFKKDKEHEIKTMVKADRRHKLDMEKMKRANERVENTLRIKSQQAQLAEKKLKEYMQKRQNVQADRSRKGAANQTTSINEVKTIIDMHIWGRFSKFEQTRLKKERADLTRKISQSGDAKQTAQYQARIKQITAQLASCQQSTHDLDRQPNPTTAKQMPIKDVAEARKIIEALFEMAVEKGSESLISKEESSSSKEKIAHLK